MSYRINVLVCLFFSLISGIQGQRIVVDTLYVDSLMQINHDLPISTKSLSRAERILTLSKQLDFERGINYSLLEIARFHFNAGDDLTAINAFQDVLKRDNNQSDIRYAYLCLARSYLSLELIDKAELYLNRIIDISEAMEDPTSLAKVNFDIGLYYVESGDYQKAISYLKHSKTLFSQTEAKGDSILTNYTLGIAYVEIGQAKLGLPYFLEILEYAKRNRDSLDLSNIHGNLGWAYHSMDLYDQAFLHYDTSLYYSKHFNLHEDTYLTYLDISKTLSKQKKYESALNFYKKHQELKDSILSFKNMQTLSDLVIKYETEEKEKELLLREKELVDLKLERQKMWQIIGGLCSILIIAGILFLKNKNELKAKQKLAYVNKELIQTQLKNETLLSSQLQSELKNKEKDLTNLALDIGRKNKFANKLISKLEILQNINKVDLEDKLREIILSLKNHSKVNEDLKILQENVEHINQSFYQKLELQFDNLTSNDKYTLGLIRLNLSNKDIASIKGISPESTKVLRYRLRKKLMLTPDINIVSFLQNL